MKGPDRTSDAPTEMAPTETPTVRAAEASTAPLDLQAALEDAGFAERYGGGEETVGRGGMGEVRAFRDRRIGREVAVKALHSGVSGSAEALGRFVREARVQGQLEHPAVVPVYDLGLDAEGEPFFSMKRLHGETLGAVLARLRSGEGDAGPAARRRLLSAFTRVCQAIDFAHARGVIHRDLKPGNIMLGGFGQVYVLDWGLARVEGEADSSPPDPTEAAAARTEAPPLDPITEEPSGSPHTAHGAVLGTPGYMAPEQLLGQPVDDRADVYALGALLFEILTLEPLHPRASAVASTIDGADARASERAPEADVPPELEALCVAAVCTEPRERPGAGELGEAVEAYLAGDRDLERRRELAAEHARAAAAASEEALADPADLEARRRAMRQAGHALGLDPDNAEALEAVTRLFTEPPSETPPQVAELLEEARTQTSRSELRYGSIIYLGLLGLAPLLMWMGVREWWVFLGLAVLFAGNAVGSFLIALQPRRREGLLAVAVLSNAILVGLSTRLFGPLVVAPAFGGVMAVGFLMHGYRRIWLLAVATFTAGVVVPLALELGGVITPSYGFAGGLTILPTGFDLPPGPTLITLGVISLTFLLLPSAFLLKVLGRSEELERRLHLQTWHLRQLLPSLTHADESSGGRADNPAPNRTRDR